MLRELEIGEATLNDILQNLKKPQLDIRDELPPPLFRKVSLRSWIPSDGRILIRLSRSWRLSLTSKKGTSWLAR